MSDDQRADLGRFSYSLPDEEELKRQVLETWRAQLEQDIGAVTCPVHGLTPHSVSISGGDGVAFSVQAATCCDSLLAEIGEVLQQRAQVKSGPW
jgi:hypothetical protein